MAHGKKIDLEDHMHWVFIVVGAAGAFLLGFLVLNNHNKGGDGIAWFFYITGVVVAIIACVLRMAQQRKYHQWARIVGYLVILSAIVVLAAAGVAIVLF